MVKQGAYFTENGSAGLSYLLNLQFASLPLSMHETFIEKSHLCPLIDACILNGHIQNENCFKRHLYSIFSVCTQYRSSQIKNI